MKDVVVYFIISSLSTSLVSQIGIELSGAGKVGDPIFAIQCFRLCDGPKFVLDFAYELQPTTKSECHNMNLYSSSSSSSYVSLNHLILKHMTGRVEY